jgi:RNA polymerase sigma-70 factor (ECF subfamily)
MKPVLNMSNLPSQVHAKEKQHQPVFMEVVSKYHVSNERQAEELAVIEAAKKDKKHFELIYNRYHEQIFRYVYQRMEDKDTAFDVTQQVFLKAMTNLHKFEYKGVPFSSWLYRIAKSEVYDVLRKDQKNRSVNIDSIQLGDMMEDMQEESNVEKYGQRLSAAIAELSEDDLQLVEMRFFEKRAFKEIGEILEITENNAKVKLYRILEKLKKVLTRK